MINLIFKMKFIILIVINFFEEIHKCLKYIKNKNRKYLTINKTITN